MTHSLTDPATTVELIRLNAVVGVVGTVSNGALTRVGITCALCHATVDNSAGAGIGQRLDGWPNRDLDPGRIIALSPALTPAQKAVYNSWGPGFYDPRFNVDGINLPVLIPPAFGLQGVGFEIYTEDGPISYWNNYVAVTQMGGQGSFCDQRIKRCKRPISCNDATCSLALCSSRYRRSPLRRSTRQTIDGLAGGVNIAELSLFHLLGKLPEPKLAHDF